MYAGRHPLNLDSLAFCSEESIPASVEYVIKDRQLLLPLYLVEVEWDPQEEKRSRQVFQHVG